MRHPTPATEDHDVPLTAHLAASQGLPAPARLRLSADWVLVSNLLWAAAAGFIGYAAVDPENGLSVLWLLHPALFGALVTDAECRRTGRGLTGPLVRLLRTPGAAPGATVFAPRWVLFGAMALVFWAGTLPSGVPLDHVAWVFSANLAGAAAMVATYRWRGIGGSWVPRTEAELLWFVCAQVAGVCVVGVLGGFPGSGPFAADGVAQLVWVNSRAEGMAAVATTTVLAFYFRSDDPLPVERATWRFALGLALAAACAAVTVVGLGSLPTVWLRVLPGLWGGLMLRRQPALVLSLCSNMMIAATPYPSITQPPLGDWLPVSANIDLCTAFVTNLVPLLVIFRQRIAAATAYLEALAETEADDRRRMDAVLETMSGGLILADRLGRVTLTNRAMATLLGAPVPAQVDAAWAHQLGLPPHTSDDPTAATTDRTTTHVTAADRHLAVSIRPVPGVAPFGHAGSGDLTLLLAKDITAAHERQRELESFAGTVAHDLRSPVAAMRGWLEVAAEALEDGADADALAALDRATGSVDRMRHLIDEYLRHAVSHGGRLQAEDVALSAVAAEIVAVYAGRPGGPVIDIDLPHAVRADPALTRQLLANLVGNGIKYSRPGEPARLRLTSRDDEPGWVQVQVADRGRGLRPGDEERIFARFSRSSQDVGDVAGVGLGLALCHAIVTRHGGWIRAENNPAGGAIFRFTLPTGRVSLPAAGTIPGDRQ